jgi:hypothetical protein
MGSFYLAAATQEEREFLASPMATDYARYRERTGCFFPRLSRSGRAAEPRLSDPSAPVTELTQTKNVSRI